MDAAAPFLVTEIAADLFANSQDSFNDLPSNKEKAKAPMKQSPEPTVSMASTECPSM